MVFHKPISSFSFYLFRQTDKSTPYVTCVTIPVQCLVKESKLLLSDSSKVSWFFSSIFVSFVVDFYMHMYTSAYPR